MSIAFAEEICVDAAVCFLFFCFLKIRTEWPFHIKRKKNRRISLKAYLGGRDV